MSLRGRYTAGSFGLAIALLAMGPSCQAGLRAKAEYFKTTIEDAADRGDIDAYTGAWQELDDYEGTLSSEESTRFFSYWKDPGISVWQNIMGLRIQERMIENLRARRRQGVEPLQDVVRRLVGGILGNRRTNPRVKDVRVERSVLSIDYRTYSEADGNRARNFIVGNLLQVLKYLTENPRLDEIRTIRVAAYQKFHDESQEEVVLRIEVPRRSIESIDWARQSTQRFIDKVERDGNLWVHSRF